MTEQKKTYYQVQQEFYEIIVDKCAHSSTLILPNKITDDLVLTDDFNMDSLDKVECIMDAEKHFDTCIEPILAEKIETVGDVVKCVYDSNSFRKEKGISDNYKYPYTETSATDLIKKAPNIPTKKPVPQPEMNLKRRLQGTDLSKLAGKTVELNGYKIVIKKLAQDTKVKGK